MSDFPSSSTANRVTIWTGGKYSLVGWSRALTAAPGNFVSTAWGTANLAIAVPVWIPDRYPVKNLFIYNFATLNGNVDVGIYNDELRLLVSVGSGTAQAGATALQFFAKDIVLEPGQYYFAMSSNSTTATFGCATIGTTVRQRYLGLVQMTSAFALPATFTPALIGQSRVPLIGVTYQSGTPNF